MEGNPSGAIIKNVFRGFAALSIPLTAGFPKVRSALSASTKLYPVVVVYKWSVHIEYLQ